jgi:hypothetical protein
MMIVLQDTLKSQIAHYLAESDALLCYLFVFMVYISFSPACKSIFRGHKNYNLNDMYKSDTYEEIACRR